MDSGLNELLAGVKQSLDALDVVELLQNPYFLIGSGLFCLLALVRRMVRSLVIFLAAVGLALLFHYTAPGQSAAVGIPGESLVTFGAGGLAICGVVIYFVFIRSE